MYTFPLCFSISLVWPPPEPPMLAVKSIRGIFMPQIKASQHLLYIWFLVVARRHNMLHGWITHISLLSHSCIFSPFRFFSFLMYDMFTSYHHIWIFWFENSLIFGLILSYLIYFRLFTRVFAQKPFT
jgi:hypothetical protein